MERDIKVNNMQHSAQHLETRFRRLASFRGTEAVAAEAAPVPTPAVVPVAAPAPTPAPEPDVEAEVLPVKASKRPSKKRK